MGLVLDVRHRWFRSDWVLVLVYAYIAIQDSFFLYGSIILIVVWAIGMVLPVKEIFGKHG